MNNGLPPSAFNLPPGCGLNDLPGNQRRSAWDDEDEGLRRCPSCHEPVLDENQKICRYCGLDLSEYEVC
jgi:ribosomal protein L32